MRIYAETKSALDAAIDRIRAITDEPEIGRIYTGIVVRIVDFGAFVNFMPGRDGLVHISQITDQRVESVGDYLKVGDEVQVKVLDVDNRGRIKLSIRRRLPVRIDTCGNRSDRRGQPLRVGLLH